MSKANIKGERRNGLKVRIQKGLLFAINKII
jgi:hypothetical protein